MQVLRVTLQRQQRGPIDGALVEQPPLGRELLDDQLTLLLKRAHPRLQACNLLPRLPDPLAQLRNLAGAGLDARAKQPLLSGKNLGDLRIRRSQGGQFRVPHHSVGATELRLQTVALRY